MLNCYAPQKPEYDIIAAIQAVLADCLRIRSSTASGL